MDRPTWPSPGAAAARETPQADGAAGCRAGAQLGGWHRGDVDEVAAGVVQDGVRERPHLGRRLQECDALRGEPIELGLHIVDGERGGRNAIGDERLLVRLRRRMCVRLQEDTCMSRQVAGRSADEDDLGAAGRIGPGIVGGGDRQVEAKPQREAQAIGQRKR